jgi:succinoglycan biosynthesis protein ExoA
MSVSILVPVLDEARRLRSTVPAMLAQRHDGDLELLLIDGGSTDGTREILAELARADERIRVLENPAGTIPAALNLGLAAARGGYVARMDAHAWYPADYVALGVERLARGDVEWVSGPAVPRGDGRWSRRIASALLLSLGQGGSRKWRAIGAAADEEWDLDTGVFAGVWRRATLQTLGGWDDTFTVNEDAEMAARMLSRGGRIVCRAQMAAYYAPRDSLAGLARQYWRFGSFRVRTSRRHPVALRPAHVASALLAAAVAVVPLAPLRRPASLACGLYALTLVSGVARMEGDVPAAERAGTAAALATMHLSWGAGFLAGCLRHGPPLRALSRLILTSASRGTP